MSKRNSGRRRIVTTTSWLALGVALALTDSAVAQTVAAPDPAGAAEVTLVEEIVVGTRASLQSAIGRKKRANTVVDSIVADDVASFPDKNVGEALQRVTGIQLSRAFGEGNGISIRGVENDLNRVETNGVSTLGFPGLASGGRGNDFRNMASELIKSVDVYKGSIASLTEGGVGGTVSIETRKPLELAKPLLSLSLSADRVDTIGSTKPRGNLTFGRKFMDDRLGVLVNVTYSDVDTRADIIRNNSWVGGTGVTAAAADTRVGGVITARGAGNGGDFDQSPERTYINPAYANITTKEGCIGVAGLTAAQIPSLQPWTPADPATGRTANSVVAPTYTAAQHFAASTNPCLAQWNDYIPQLARYGVWNRNDKRLSGVFTLQYQVNDALDAYVEYSRFEREQTLIDRTVQLGITNPNNLDLTTDASGKLVNMVIDKNHNVIDYRSNSDPNVIANNGALGAPASGLALLGSNARDFSYNSLDQYVNAGFNYREGPLEIKGMAVHSWNHLADETNAINLTADINGPVRIKLDENGNSEIILPAGTDLNAPSLWNRPAALNYRPSDGKNTEDMAKLDFDLEIDRFGITKVEWGGQVRKYTANRYSNGSYTVPANPATGQPAYTVLGANQTPSPTFVTPSTLPCTAQNVPANCYYGLNGRGQSLADYIAGIPRPMVWTPAHLAAYVKQVGVSTPGTFEPGGDSGVGFSPPTSWLYGDFNKIGDYYDLSTFTRKYLFVDANGVPKTPDYDLSEQTNALYGMANYAFEVFGMPVGGNFGVRFVRTQVAGTSLNTRIDRRLVNGVTTNVTVSSSINTIEKEYSNTLPSFNLSVGIVPDKVIARLGWAKVMSRPRASDIVRGVSCTFDVTPVGSQDNIRDTCTGGNPFLKPYLADTYDLTVGWYPNRDTLLNAGVFYKDITSYVVGNQVQTLDFYGDGKLFDVTAPVNGQGAKLSGFELSAQTAFTFLPAPLDGFGASANYTYTDTPHSNVYSVLTGEEMAFAGNSKHSYNLIFYYDKGPYNARIAYNYRSQYLINYPAANAVAGNFVDAAGYLDAKVVYRVPNSGLSLSLEALNLTGETDRRTQGEDPVRQQTDEYSGKRLFATVAWKF